MLSISSTANSLDKSKPKYNVLNALNKKQNAKNCKKLTGAKDKKEVNKVDVNVPKLKVVKASERSGESAVTNADNKTVQNTEEVKLTESAKSSSKPQEKVEPMDTEIVQKQESIECKEADQSMTKINEEIDDTSFEQVKNAPETPELSSKKSNFTSSGVTSNLLDGHKSEKINIALVKMKSEEPIKNLHKSDTNSSAINLLSPNNSSTLVKNKRKTSGISHFHQDGASIISANLSSDMGTAYFQGSARRKSVTSRNESPELNAEVDVLKQTYGEPMSYVIIRTVDNI